jgi:hypothetical protein
LSVFALTRSQRSWLTSSVGDALLVAAYAIGGRAGLPPEFTSPRP